MGCANQKWMNESVSWFTSWLDGLYETLVNGPVRTLLQHQITRVVFFLPPSSFTSTKTKIALQWLLEKPWHGRVGIEATPQVPCWHFNKARKWHSVAVCCLVPQVPWGIDYMFRILGGQKWLSVFLTSTGHVGPSPFLLLCPWPWCPVTQPI